VPVHARIDSEDAPVNFRCMEIEAPDTLAVDDVDVNGRGQSWKTDLAATRWAGDQMAKIGCTALLRVPSVIVPATWSVRPTRSIRKPGGSASSVPAASTCACFGSRAKYSRDPEAAQ
jgi:hypothetical protein